MKKLLYIISGFLLISLFLNSCKQKEQFKIGFLMDALIQERWEKDQLYFTEKAEELKCEVLIRTAEGNEQKQLKQAKDLLEQGVDVLVIVAVNRMSAGKIVDMSHKRGVKVIAYDRLIRDSNLDYYISFDNIRVGELQAEYLTKRLPTGNYAIISGPISDNNSFLIRLGQMNILQPLIEKGDVQLVFDQYAEAWLEDEGEKMARACLKKVDKIDAFLCANDALAQGAIKVLREKKLNGDVLVAGQDAELNACRSIVAGDQTMSVYKPIKAIAVTAAETAAKIAKREKVQSVTLRVNNGKRMVPAILLPSQIVNVDNIKMTVVVDKYVDEKEIYK